MSNSGNSLTSGNAASAGAKPFVLATESDQVTDAQLNKYADLVYDRTGIRISPQKKTLLSNRLRRRLRETGIKGFDEYFKHIKDLKDDDPEWDAFLQEITTHETYLFRDEAHWKWFREEFLPSFQDIVSKEKRPKALRIWSAACSTGDEPMTIASCIAACLPNFNTWKIQIVATDIGVGALEHAKEALYGERAMKLVPDDYKKRFFTQGKGVNVWQAKPVLTEMITFKQHNLMDPMRDPLFDLVFVKNVLIYFDPASKATVLGNVKNALRPGAMLLAGAAEGVSDHVKDLERIHPWLYRKPLAEKK